MIELIRPLLELQTLEKELLDAQKQYTLCENNFASIEVLKQKLQQELSRLKTELYQKKQAYQEGESNLEQLENLLIQQKARQATAKKSDEFKALEVAIQETDEKISTLQDELINTLEELEKFEADLEQVKVSSEKKLNDFVNQQNQINQQKLQTKSLIEKKEAELKAFEGKLKGPFYEAYLTLRKCNKAIPRVVAITEDRKCSGCFLTLSAELVSKLDDSKVPQFCEHCGRILYK